MCGSALEGGVVAGCAQSGSGVCLLPEEFRQARFQVGDVLTLAAETRIRLKHTPT